MVGDALGGDWDFVQTEVLHLVYALGVVVLVTQFLAFVDKII